MATNSQIVTLDDEPDASIAQSATQVSAVAASGGGHGQESYLSGRKAICTFYEQDGDMGKDGIYAALNGVGYNIPRGVQVSIPVELLEVLNNAITRSLETTQDGGQRERDVMRFSCQVHGYVDAPKEGTAAKKSAK